LLRYIDVTWIVIAPDFSVLAEMDERQRKDIRESLIVPA